MGHGPPDFSLALCLAPKFGGEFHVKVRLIDIYSKLLSAIRSLNDLKTFCRGF